MHWGLADTQWKLIEPFHKSLFFLQLNYGIRRAVVKLSLSRLRFGAATLDNFSFD